MPMSDKQGKSYGMEGDAAPISKDFQPLRTVLGPNLWGKIENLPDPNAFLHAWVDSVPILIGLVRGSTDQVCYVTDEAKHSFKAKTGAGAGTAR